MSDWQVGDLALCVRGGCGELSRFKLHGELRRESRDGRVTAGRIYTVCRVRVADDGVGLGFNEEPGPWHASRFRKIPPHTRDAEDDETIRLLTGAPVLEPTALTAWRERWNDIEEEV